MRRIFLGRALDWALLVGLVVALSLLGAANLHTRAFNLFSLVVVALVVIAFAVILATARPGRQITREPLEDAPSGDGGMDDS